MAEEYDYEYKADDSRDILYAFGRQGDQADWFDLPGELLQAIFEEVAAVSPKTLRNIRLVSCISAFHSERLFYDQFRDIKITLDPKGFARLGLLMRSARLRKAIKTVNLIPAEYPLTHGDMILVYKSKASPTILERLEEAEIEAGSMEAMYEEKMQDLLDRLIMIKMIPGAQLSFIYVYPESEDVRILRDYGYANGQPWSEMISQCLTELLGLTGSVKRRRGISAHPRQHESHVRRTTKRINVFAFPE